MSTAQSPKRFRDSAAFQLDTIRCEKLATSGCSREASAVSSARVYIDKLRRAYHELHMADIKSAEAFEEALENVVGDLSHYPKRDAEKASTQMQQGTPAGASQGGKQKGKK